MVHVKLNIRSFPRNADNQPYKAVANLFTKSNSIPSLSRHDADMVSSTTNSQHEAESQAVREESRCSSSSPVPPYLSSNLQVTDLDEDSDTDRTLENSNHGANSGNKAEPVDVDSWNSALETALEERKQQQASFEENFAVTTPRTTTSNSPMRKIDEGGNDETITPSPQSRAEYSAEDAEDEFSNAEDLPGLRFYMIERVFLGGSS